MTRITEHLRGSPPSSLKPLLVPVVASMVLISLAPALALPATDPGWRSWTYEGNQEPGTGLPGQSRGDFDPHGMWQAPNYDGADVDGDGKPDAIQDRIYFDAIIDKVVHPLTPSPNADGTRVRSYVQTYFHAFLGFWRDCNRDAFIGDAHTGSVQYPVTAAVDTVTCPEGTPYNDGVQVVEFLVIGPNARDLDPGSGAQSLCPQRDGGPSGDAQATPRAKHDGGVWDGGRNLVCLGGTDRFVQDDFAKVWHDWGLPNRTGETGVSLFPFPDGTLRETNGHFRLLDMATQEQLSARAPGLWPAKPERGDPAQPNQCRSHNDPLASDGTLPVAVTNLQEAEDRGFSCSPVPNVRYVTVPLAGPVAWPGHLVEDRWNNSDTPTEKGDPITMPFHEEGNRCELNGDVDEWDGEADDGDPVAGGSVSGDPQGFVQSYAGPGDGGPSLQPTLDHGYGVLVSRAESEVPGAEDRCRQREGIPGSGHPPEENAAASSATLKVGADSPFTFVMDDHFNPSEAPGVGPDTPVCTPQPFTFFGGYAPRCQGHWLSSEQYRSTHGITALAPNLQESFLSTFYADVSFGEKGNDCKGLGWTPAAPGQCFDPAGDGAFGLSTHGVWDGPPAVTGFRLDPDVNLPAGRDNAHQYGDEQCDAVSPVWTAPGGFDSTAAGDITAGSTTTWSCDRQAWVARAELDCGKSADELACYLLPKVGDGYDLRDIECYDNDILGFGTTDASGPLQGSGLVEPGVDCQGLDPTWIPDLS